MLIFLFICYLVKVGAREERVIPATSAKFLAYLAVLASAASQLDRYVYFAVSTTFSAASLQPLGFSLRPSKHYSTP